jgi:sporulation protein YlmC with PRC-barrel domain
MAKGHRIAICHVADWPGRPGSVWQIPHYQHHRLDGRPVAHNPLKFLFGKNVINLNGGLFMKMNKNLAMVIVVGSCLTLPVGARQTQTYNNGNMPGDRDSGNKVGYKELEKANKIIGMEIKDPQEHKLGKVKDLAIDLKAGRIAEVIVGTGGVVGLDEKMVAIPPESLTFANSGKELKLNDAETFKIAPFFKMAQWNEATSPAKVADVYERFHVTPHGAPAYLARADKIMGLTAMNPQSEHLGKVETLVVDLPAGRVVEVIVASGGFLGIKDELSAVPPQAFRFDPGKDLLTLDTTRETLKNAPHFKPGDWRNSVNNPVSLAGVYNAYSVAPYFSQGSAETAGQNAVPQGTMKPTNAPEAQSDMAISARIQQLILAADGLSADARAVQVTAQSGRVTLRGTASSDKEKKQLGDLAATVVPADHVDNQIEVRDIGASASMSGN